MDQQRSGALLFRRLRRSNGNKSSIQVCFQLSLGGAKQSDESIIILILSDNAEHHGRTNESTEMSRGHRNLKQSSVSQPPGVGQPEPIVCSEIQPSRQDCPPMCISLNPLPGKLHTTCDHFLP